MVAGGCGEFLNSCGLALAATTPRPIWRENNRL